MNYEPVLAYTPLFHPELSYTSFILYSLISLLGGWTSGEYQGIPMNAKKKTS